MRRTNSDVTWVAVLMVVGLLITAAVIGSWVPVGFAVLLAIGVALD